MVKTLCFKCRGGTGLIPGEPGIHMSCDAAKIKIKNLMA